MYPRMSGIIMHISSLPSKYGIGDFGKSAYTYVDFLKRAKQKIWQILPFGITGYGDSPYQSVSAFAGNPLYIDLDILINRGFICNEDLDFTKVNDKPECVAFDSVKEIKYTLLRKAYRQGFKTDQLFIEDFYNENKKWLAPFCAFMTIKNKVSDAPWQKWDDDYKYYSVALISKIKERYSDEFWFWVFTQYHFFDHWYLLKHYANEKGIQVMGDIPIYVSEDSVDIWANPKQFAVDEDYNLSFVAGCPPDAFSEEGQLWGNPIYRWDIMKLDDYQWWTERIRHSFLSFDIVRIDHFKGFDSYWKIPSGSKTAAVGEWVKGPGSYFFERLKEKLGQKKIIAEDLGFVDKSVIKLRTFTGFPGMAILQFAFDTASESDYLPHNLNVNSVVYTGTHDNDTVVGWLEKAPQDTLNYVSDYLRLNEDEGLAWGVIRGAWASNCCIAIAQMQDFLELSSDARMNTPATLGGNWSWRITEDSLTDHLADRIAKLTTLYSR